MELERTIASKVEELHRVFPCVMVTGARQVGKSTLLKSLSPEDYFSAYLSTYIARDVRALTQVGDTSAFLRFMQAVAARTAQQLVYADLAKDADVSPNTAKRWLSVLETSGIIDILPPYYVNTSKRLTKSPKLYFADTGFCAWLGGGTTPRVLQQGAMAGPMLETWAYGQLRRSYCNRGIRAKLSYYRSSNGAEVDFVLERDGKLFPMEVKRSSSPRLSDLSAVAGIPLAPGVTLRPGLVLCTATQILPLGRGCHAYPISMI